MLPRTQLSRRTFLKVSATAGGGLLIGSYLAACAPDITPTLEPTSLPVPTDVPIPAPTATPVPEPPFVPGMFIRIDPDGMVTLTIHRSEMGQGVHTALAMILAEELEADWTKVRVEQSPANPQIGGQTTGGSGSVADHYAILREAGARAREILIAAAAETWGVTTAECKAENGAVVNTAAGDSLGYGELVTAAKAVKLRTLPQPKDPATFKLIGTSVPRIDDPDIVTGKAIYGLDVRIPNMMYAVVARCPVPGGTVASFDGSAAEAVPGVRAVVEVSTGIAVVAENTWAAIQGREALTITWDEGENAIYSSDSIHEELAGMIERATAGEKADGLTTIDAIYETPYLAHAAMEPVNCIADVRADGSDIYAPTQNPQDVQGFVARALGVQTAVHVTLLGGGFGRRLEVDYAIEAAQVSKAFGGPVQVVWTRDDDLQRDYYRQPTYHWMRAGWDAEENLVLWRHYIAAPGINGIAYKVGQEVLEDGLAVPYGISGKVSRALLAEIDLPTGPWRAVVNGPNAFANECFFDEVAAALKKDPYEFRLSLMPETNPLYGVLQLAAEKAGWGTELPAGHGRGIACHTYHQTAVAMVAEASVEGGVIKVHKVVCAIDCGLVINPDMVRQQMEGCVVYALTSLLKGEITFEGGRVQQANFSDYPLLQMNEMPEVEVHMVPGTGAPTGVGEMGVPPLVPAVLNAIFAVTGVMVRHTPVREGDLAVVV